ncbi:MAG: hypothetical protein GWP91_02040 [Rhodobacterales bacterium]|nr:hypothetical protein [Rhodobacterales bacterium]
MDLSSYKTLHVTAEDEGRIIVLEFDHGKANEMGFAQLTEFERLTADLIADNEAVALITWSQRRSSRGTPIFVAGANVTERGDWPKERVVEHVRWQRRVLKGLRTVPVFHIAVVSGVALGWGTEYMLVSDYRIAAEGAVFGLPETGLGILPGAGGTAELWAHIGVAQTLRLGMTGERILPEEAQRIGLIQESMSTTEQAMERARSLARRAAKNSPTAMAAFKSGVLASVGADPADRSATEVAAYEHCVETGQAAIGRTHFKDIRNGITPPWGSRVMQGDVS